MAAARTGVFDGVTRIIDVGGGSGRFAIPFALDNPKAEVLLLEHPTVAPFVAPYLQRYGVADRVTVAPVDVFAEDWGIDAGRCRIPRQLPPQPERRQGLNTSLLLLAASV